MTIKLTQNQNPQALGLMLKHNSCECIVQSLRKDKVESDVYL